MQIYWTNVTPSNPCPICKRGDWCFLSQDGHYAGCRREGRFDGEHRIDASSCDYWLYDLTGVTGHIVTPPPPAIPKDQEPFRADVGILNKVYRALLDKLTLSTAHRENLQQRGLSDEEIDRRGYRTWPKSGRAAIAKALAVTFGDNSLKTIPGIYLKSDPKDHSIKFWSLAGGSGMAIPVRDDRRRIIGIRIRLDDPSPGWGKYIWLSSAKHNGPSPGSPLHFPGFDDDISLQETIRITEGELKADITTVLSNVFTLSLPGILNWRATLKHLEKFPSLKTIKIAFDSDATTNILVARALKELAFALCAKEYNVEIETWDPAVGKGIDDVLVAQGTISIISGEHVGPRLEEILETAKRSSPPVNVRQLEEAKESIGLANLCERIQSPEFFNDPSNIESLATIKRLSPGDWLTQIKPIFRKQGLWQEVNKLVDGHKNGNCIHAGGPLPATNGSASKYSHRTAFYPMEAHSPPLRPSVKSIFEDAPVSNEIIIPDGWDFGTGGIWRTRNKFPEKVCDVPVIIDRRMKDVSTGVEHVSLRWKCSGRWATYIAPKSTVFSSRKIVDISDYGLPVRSDNSLNLSKWLGDFESINYDALPISSISSQLGWQGRNGNLGFLLGENYYKTSSKSPQHIEFRGVDTGDQRLASGFQSEGTLESWIEAVTPVARYPRVLLMLYASFAAAIMPILDAPNFIIDSSSVTSRGKTVSLRVAGSVWGNPDERSNRGTVVHSWNNTNVFIERLSSTLGNLPVLLDDTKQVRKREMIASILYMFACGHGRGRGSQKGTQDTLHWNTILLSTGEQKITSFTKDGGTRARVLSIWHPNGPFERIDQETAIAVNQLNNAILKNYGTAGKRFVEWLIEHREDWPLFKQKYREQQEEYAQRAGNNPVAIRLTDFFAVIDLAAVLVHAAIKPPWLYRDPIESLWNDLTEDSETDLSQEAISYVMSWAQSHEHTFLGRESKGNDSPYTKAPMGGWSGRWEDDEDWESIAFYPHLLKQLIEEGGFDYDSTIRIWRDKGWLDAGGDRKRFTKKVKINGSSSWMSIIRRDAIEKENDYEYL